MSQEYHATSRKMVSGKKRKGQANKEKDGIRQYALHGFPYAFQTQVLKKLQPTPRESGEEYVKFLLSPEYELEPPEIDGEDEEDMLAYNGSENNARQTPTTDQDNSKEKTKDDMEVDGAKMDEKVVLDIVEEQLHVVVSKGEEKGVQEHFEAQVNVDVWKGEEKGV
ncbi:hypothetical protein LWI29_034717 [Acer saccharum]|uniref:Uncharacterized protein n=1 Tax=Acer saccharum TaxID=4024 RepID=A0AA39W1D0_ACESA|nr:hypothetical protein LWI29_034717 [Acer saccharum]